MPAKIPPTTSAMSTAVEQRLIKVEVLKILKNRKRGYEMTKEENAFVGCGRRNNKHRE